MKTTRTTKRIASLISGLVAVFAFATVFAVPAFAIDESQSIPVNITIQDTCDSGGQNPDGENPGNPNIPPKVPNSGMITLFGNREMPIWAFVLLLALVAGSSVAIFILLHRHHKQAHQFDVQEAVNRHLEKHIDHPTKAEHIDNLVISKLHFNHWAKLHSRKWGLTLAVPAVAIGLMLIVLPARAAVTDPYITITPEYNSIDITIDKCDIPANDTSFTKNVQAKVTTQTNIPAGYTLNATGTPTDPKISLQLEDNSHNNLGVLDATPVQLSQTSSADEIGVVTTHYIDVTIASDIAVGTYSSTLTYDAQGDYFPGLASIAPNKGSSAGGTNVTITGSNFTSDTVVYFGTITATNKCTNLNLSNETTLTCTVPAGIPGTVDVTIITMGGQIDLTDGFTFVSAPTISSVSPSAGPTTGGAVLTITGTNFDPTDTGLNVKVGGVDCAITSVTSTTITCTTANSSAGQKDVVVTNGVGDSDSKTSAYNYLDAPTFNSINPSIGPLSGGATITVTGTNFDNITNTTAVTLGGQTCDSLNVQSATTLTCVVPATASAGPVSLVIATAGGTSSNADVYTYAAAPTIADVQPTNITSGTAITITGTNYIVGGTTVTIDGQTCTVTNVTTTSITCTAPTLSGGSLDVTVATIGGSATANSSVNYHDSPTANVPTPGSGVVAGGTLITITGTNFDTIAGNTTVSVGGNDCLIQSITAIQITCTTAGHSAGQVDVEVSTTGGSVTLQDAFQYLSPPSLSSINPSSGPTGGGQSVTLTGADFDTITNSNVVTIGGANCAITAISATTITCTTPAGAMGAKNVVVTTGGGSDNLPGAYTYSPVPGVTSVNPNSVPLTGGNVTIYGSNFVSGATTVQVGGQACASVNVISANQLACTAPSLAAGLASITVTTPGGTGSGNNLLNYLPQPTISSVNPIGGLLAGGTPVTITGTGFDTVGNTNSVKIDNNTCTITTATATAITCTVPAGSSGAKDVTVDTAGGTATSTSSYAYYDVPTGTQITPNYDSITGGKTVTITGVGLDNLNFIQFGTNPSDICINITNQSATSLQCQTPAHAVGRVDVLVSTAGGTDTIVDGFNYLTTPTLASVTPSSGAASGGTSVVLTGTGFDDLTNTNFVAFGGSACNISSATTTSITCITTAHVVGIVDIDLTTGGGTASLAAAYAYLAIPTITSVVQSSGAYSGVNAGPIAGSTPVTVTGTNFDTANNSNVISLGGSTCASVNVISPTQLTCTTSAHSAGMVAAQITTAGGTSTLSSAFNYLSTPIISNVTPPNISGGVLITITGGNYDHQTGTTSILLNGNACISPSVTASTITCTTPTLSPGSVGVTVATAGGSTTASSNPTYHDAPSITAISPTSGPTGSATAITITGTNFVAGTGNTTVTIDGTNCGSVNVTSSSSLTCQTPTHSAGTVDVVLTTVGGSDTAYGGFTYVPNPTVDSVSPSQGPLAGNTTITITGTDFDTVTGMTVVKVGGNVCSSPSVQSATKITCTLPAGTAGPKTVTVETTGGNSSKADAYEYIAAPTVATISPNSGPTAGGTSVTITGTGFRNATGTSVISSVLVGTSSCASLNVTSSTSLTCTVPASSLTPTNGTVSVSITTVGGVASLSGAYTYRNLPTISNVLPNYGPTTGDTTVTITGTNFRNSLGNSIVSSVTIGGQAVTPTVTSSTQMVITTPAHAAGSVNIVITTSAGTVTGTDAYEYVTPKIVVDTDPAMIPVKYTGSTSAPQWQKADANNIGYDWFDYDNKLWANAVTVTAASRASYQGAAVGTVINQADVVGYWVYIPRFRYQTWTFGWSASNFPRAINVDFERCYGDGTVCTDPAYSKSDVSDVLTGGVGTWVTHPAFTFNGHELNGFWVGKYEMTGTAAAPTSLPDQVPVAKQSIGAMFDGAKSIASANAGGHGITSAYSDTRILNNDNWGAITYLSQSIYGVCTNAACTDSGSPATTMSPANAQKIWMNGTGGCSSPYNAGKTGYGNNGKNDACSNSVGVSGAGAAGSGTYAATNAYYSNNGMLASSANNPTGVYDLAGSLWECTLSVYNNNMATANSGISAFDSKYMNNYPNPPLANNSDDIYNGRLNLTATFTTALGQALFETGGTASTTGMWHGDYSNSYKTGWEWAVRGGSSDTGVTGGVFANSGDQCVNSYSGSYLGGRLLLSKP
ncbi:hypothetical protein FACS189431_3410 [Alphaproteobacteria bacterium]|nr:hypothetical protein FACS189431_3410 [Alphaproteobacteria bacterium]